MFVAADVTKSADVQAYVKAALDAYGRIDCFFNNAGIEGNVAARPPNTTRRCSTR